LAKLLRNKEPGKPKAEAISAVRAAKQADAGEVVLDPPGAGKPSEANPAKAATKAQDGATTEAGRAKAGGR
jgi:hypothetical protein